MPMKFRPTEGRLLVKEMPPQEIVTKGGIEVPPTIERMMCEAVVLDIGPPRVSEQGEKIYPTPHLEKGDMITKHAQTGWKPDPYNPDLSIIEFKDVIGIVEDVAEEAEGEEEC